MAVEPLTSTRTEQLSELLPLRVWTPKEWAETALADELALLNDHAHLEKKAATNALSLLQRWPQGDCPDHWVQAITSIARDESQHLAMVARILRNRGGHVSRQHEVVYARELHALVRYGQAERELLDKLLISALIEARSCERFALLGEATTDATLSKLYRGLWASERGHYQLFIELARTALPNLDVEERWSWFLDREGEIIMRQPPGARIHSWVADQLE